MSQITAMTSVRSLLERIPGWSLLHPDQPTTMQDAVKPACRYYAPQLLSSDGSFSTWLATVDVITDTVDTAQSEGDRLLQHLLSSPTRYPKPQLQPRAMTFREAGYARCNIQFQLITDSPQEET